MRQDERSDFWSRQSETAKAILVGMHGKPELKPDERRRFLGEFEERVLASLTRAQVMAEGTDQKVAAAIKDSRAAAVIVNAEIPFADAHKYEDLAEQNGVPFTMRGDPEFAGQVGLVVVAREAVL